jgi:hypothetical protein
MARRGIPRILAAQREGTRQRLIGTGMLPERSTSYSRRSMPFLSDKDSRGTPKRRTTG